MTTVSERLIVAAYLVGRVDYPDIYVSADKREIVVQVFKGGRDAVDALLAACDSSSSARVINGDDHYVGSGVVSGVPVTVRTVLVPALVSA